MQATFDSFRGNSLSFTKNIQAILHPSDAEQGLRVLKCESKKGTVEGHCCGD